MLGYQVLEAAYVLDQVYLALATGSYFVYSLVSFVKVIDVFVRPEKYKALLGGEVRVLKGVDGLIEGRRIFAQHLA